MTEKNSAAPSFAETTLAEFLEQVASGAPVPGGGSVAALGAALAAALIEMVANLTIGKKGYEAWDADMRALAEQAGLQRRRMTEAIDRDSNAYQAVLEAFALPKETAADKDLRRRAVQDALKTAAAVPLAVGKEAATILEGSAKAVEGGNQNAATDGAVGAMMARTAGLAALYNVTINLRSITDEAFVAETSDQVRELARTITRKESDVLSKLGMALGEMP